MSGENKRISFDNYVESYEKEIQSSIGFCGQAHEFYIKLKADIIKDIAGTNFSNSGEIRVLDIGSGIGLIDHHLATSFKNLFGVDIEEKVTEKAKLYNPSVNYNHYDGVNLPFGDNNMDLVFAINVMHHVPGDGWTGFVKEMKRVVKHGGIAIIFEHNPLNPLTQLAVDKCEFDRDAILLRRGEIKKLFNSFGFVNIKTKYILFFPFRLKIFRAVEKLIGWLPLGAQYYITGQVK